jgi:hypothetical protein
MVAFSVPILSGLWAGLLVGDVATHRLADVVAELMGVSPCVKIDEPTAWAVRPPSGSCSTAKVISVLIRGRDGRN